MIQDALQLPYDVDKASSHDLPQRMPDFVIGNLSEYRGSSSSGGGARKSLLKGQRLSTSQLDSDSHIKPSGRLSKTRRKHRVSDPLMVHNPFADHGSDEQQSAANDDVFEEFDGTSNPEANHQGATLAAWLEQQEAAAARHANGEMLGDEGGDEHLEIPVDQPEESLQGETNQYSLSRADHARIPFDGYSGRGEPMQQMHLQGYHGSARLQQGEEITDLGAGAMSDHGHGGGGAGMQGMGRGVNWGSVCPTVPSSVSESVRSRNTQRTPSHIPGSGFSSTEKSGKGPMAAGWGGQEMQTSAGVQPATDHLWQVMSSQSGQLSSPQQARMMDRLSEMFAAEGGMQGYNPVFGTVFGNSLQLQQQGMHPATSLAPYRGGAVRAGEDVLHDRSMAADEWDEWLQPTQNMNDVSQLHGAGCTDIDLNNSQETDLTEHETDFPTSLQGSPEGADWYGVAGAQVGSAVAGGTPQPTGLLRQGHSQFAAPYVAPGGNAGVGAYNADGTHDNGTEENIRKVVNQGQHGQQRLQYQHQSQQHQHQHPHQMQRQQPSNHLRMLAGNQHHHHQKQQQLNQQQQNQQPHTMHQVTSLHGSRGGRLQPTQPISAARDMSSSASGSRARAVQQQIMHLTSPEDARAYIMMAVAGLGAARGLAVAGGDVKGSQSTPGTGRVPQAARPAPGGQIEHGIDMPGGAGLSSPPLPPAATHVHGRDAQHAQEQVLDYQQQHTLQQQQQQQMQHRQHAH